MDANTLLAAKDATHPEHQSALGKVLATVLLGVTDALVAGQDGKNIPASISDFVRGFLHIWMQSAPAPK